MSAQSSIQVTVRVRPFTIREAAQVTRPDESTSFFGNGSLANSAPPKPLATKGLRKIVKVIDEKCLVFDPNESNPVTRFQKTILPAGKKVKDMRYGFDRVFDENATQDEVYDATSAQLLDSVLEGYNATVFAYGATGCGKTHTISGTKAQPGIIYLTLQDLLKRIEDLKSEKDIELTISYLEIYNETIRDLLQPDLGNKQGLALREDSKNTISVAGLSSHKPSSVEEVMELIDFGNNNRSKSPTEANAVSSRSHAVLQICVTQKEKMGGMSEQQTASVLSMIDLAGSERASVTKNRGDRLLEGANINRSLLALGNCINALCENRRGMHIPYRDSKLTRLLKFSLGGNCKTVMIVCVSPSSSHYDETHNTLKYADRAKRIKTKVSRNLIDVNRHVGQYVQTIYKLQQEVAQLKSRMTDVTKEAVEKMKKEQGPRDLAMRDASRRLKSAYELSKELRSSRLADLKNLRFLQKQTALVNAWLHAFDAAFADKADEPLPSSLFKIRQVAEKLLRDMDDQQQALNVRMSGDGPEKAIDTALENIIKSMKSISGVSDIDLSTVNAEANLYKTMIERDIFHGIAESEVDSSNSVYILAQAQFQAIATINSIINMDQEEAAEILRKSLASTAQTLVEAASHIISPNGEPVSFEALYNPSMMSPKKRKSSTAHNMSFSMGTPQKSPKKSPKKALFPLPNGNSPARMPGSPRLFKAPLPKLAVQFKKKERKNLKVRWQDEESASEDAGEGMDITMDTTMSAPPPPQQLSLPALQDRSVGMHQLPQEQFLPSRQLPDDPPYPSFQEAPSAPRRSEAPPAPSAQPMRPPVRPPVRNQPESTSPNTGGDPPAFSQSTSTSTQASSQPVRSSHLQAGFLAKKSHSQVSPVSAPAPARDPASLPLQESDVRRLIINARQTNSSPLLPSDPTPSESLPNPRNPIRASTSSFMRPTTSSSSRRSSTGSNSSTASRRRTTSATHSPNGISKHPRPAKLDNKENGLLTPKPVKTGNRRLTVTTSSLSREQLERALAETALMGVGGKGGPRR